MSGLSWVHLIWLADVTVPFHSTVRLKVFDYNPTQSLVKNEAVNAPIEFQKIVIVMIIIDIDKSFIILYRDQKQCDRATLTICLFFFVATN